MTFNIADFSSQINRLGLSRTNLFFVQISLPTKIKFLEQSMTVRDLSFLCKAATMPGMELQTINIRNSTLSPMEKRPSEFEYTNLPVVFMVDSNFKVLKFFHRWMQAIINYNGAQSEHSMDSQGKLAYEFDYKENYAATIDIIMYSGHDANLIYSYKFYNAFPVSLGDVTVSWENDADVMQLPVGFTYDRLSVTGAELGKVSGDLNRGNGLLTYLSAINGYGQAINQLKRPRELQDLINQVSNASTILSSL